MAKWYKECDDPQPFGLQEMLFDATKADDFNRWPTADHNMSCPTCGKEKSVNIDELKPGVETDRLISESLDMQWDVDDGNNPYWIDGKDEFQPSTDLNAAFWAAEQLGKMFEVNFHPTKMTARVFVYSEPDDPLVEPRRQLEVTVHDSLAMALCEAILRVKGRK